MSQRLDAAAKAVAKQDRTQHNTYRDHAEAALTAADAVMFSDEAIERAAMALNAEHSLAWDILPDWVKNDWRKQVRIMIDALKGDA